MFTTAGSMVSLIETVASKTNIESGYITYPSFTAKDSEWPLLVYTKYPVIDGVFVPSNHLLKEWLVEHNFVPIEEKGLSVQDIKSWMKEKIEKLLTEEEN